MKSAALMDSDRVFSLWLNVMPLLGMLGMGAGLVFWLRRKYGSVHGSDHAAELDFERSMLETMPPVGPQIRHAASAASSSTAMPLMGADVAQTPERAVHPSAQPATNVSPLAESITSKLAAGNLLDTIEGPLRSNNPAISGTILRLRGGKRIAVIEGDPPLADPEFEILFRRFDAIVVAGPEEPLVMKRFQTLIGELSGF